MQFFITKLVLSRCIYKLMTGRRCKATCSPWEIENLPHVQPLYGRQSGFATRFIIPKLVQKNSIRCGFRNCSTGFDKRALAFAATLKCSKIQCKAETTQFDQQHRKKKEKKIQHYFAYTVIPGKFITVFVVFH